MHTDVTNTVISKLAEHCEQNNVVVVVDENTSLQQLELDSLALMEVIYTLEEALGLTLELNDLPALRSVGDLVALINRKAKSAA